MHRVAQGGSVDLDAVAAARNRQAGIAENVAVTLVFAFDGVRQFGQQPVDLLPVVAVERGNRERMGFVGAQQAVALENGFVAPIRQSLLGDRLSVNAGHNLRA